MLLHVWRHNNERKCGYTDNLVELSIYHNEGMLTMNTGSYLSYSRDKRRLFCSFLEVTQYPNNSYSLVCVQTKMLLW